MTLSPVKHPTAVLLIVLVSYLMIILDISIVITGLPHIQQSLHFSATGLSWVQSAYTLVFGGLLLLGARAGDILGRRRMLMLGLGLFTAASLAIGLAQSAGWMIMARAIQGAGAAILAPATLALLSTTFAEGTARTRALGYYGATAGVGSSIGLVLGGLLADSWSWRVGFFINLPIGLALILAARQYLDETPRHSGQFDIAGAISATLGLAALIYSLIQAAATGWHHHTTLTALGIAVVSIAFFIWHEGRASQPIMPLKLFRHRERAGAYLARLFFLGGMIGFWFFSTQFLQAVLGWSAFASGLAFLPATLINFVAALLVPALTRKFGNTRVLSSGLLISVLGLFSLSQVSVHSSYILHIALPMLLIGAGQGLSLSPLTIAAVQGVPAQDAGAASGIVNVAHQLGSAIGLAVLIVVFSSAYQPALPAPERLTQQISSALFASACMLLAALITVLISMYKPVSKKPALLTP